jgi:predicted nucleotidyltransferase
MPTALELSKEERKQYVEAALRRSKSFKTNPEKDVDREQLLVHVRKAAAVLKTQFAVHRVVLFGSLAHESWFVPDSDVDLAVEGLDPKDYWQAWQVVEDIVGNRPVDLIEIETASESLRRAIERYGIEL